MGVKASRTDSLHGNENDMLMEAMPDYFVSDIPCEIDVSLAQQSWVRIMDDTSHVFRSLVKSNECSFTTSFPWFFTCFFNRIFETSSIGQEYFPDKNVESESRAILGAVSIILMQLRDPEGFQEILSTLAKRHFERGVRSTQYAAFGAALFWTLRKCLGDDDYSEATHFAWTKLYCSVLRGIIPTAVKLEYSLFLAQEEIKNSGQKRSESPVSEWIHAHSPHHQSFLPSPLHAKHSEQHVFNQESCSHVIDDSPVLRTKDGSSHPHSSCNTPVEKPAHERRRLCQPSSHFTLSDLCCSHSAVLYAYSPEDDWHVGEQPDSLLITDVKVMELHTESSGEVLQNPSSIAGKSDIDKMHSAPPAHAHEATLTRELIIGAPSAPYSLWTAVSHTKMYPETAVEVVPRHGHHEDIMPLLPIKSTNHGEEDHHLKRCKETGCVKGRPMIPRLPMARASSDRRLEDQKIAAESAPLSAPLSRIASWKDDWREQSPLARALSAKNLSVTKKEKEINTKDARVVEMKEKTPQQTQTPSRDDPPATLTPVPTVLTPAMRTNILTFTRMSLLKRRALLLLARRCLTSSDVYNLLVLFNRIDMNCEGHICVLGIGLAMVFQGEGHLLDEFQHLVESMGLTKNEQKMNFSDFQAAILDPFFFALDQNIRWMFVQLDPSDVGHLTFEGINAALEENTKLSRAEFDVLDENHDGIITFSGFEEMIRRVPCASTPLKNHVVKRHH